MSVPAECYQQLDEFLAPYEELRWLHEIQTKQYHSACSTLISCANIEEQCLSKQKVMPYISILLVYCHTHINWLKSCIKLISPVLVVKLIECHIPHSLNISRVKFSRLSDKTKFSW